MQTSVSEDVKSYQQIMVAVQHLAAELQTAFGTALPQAVSLAVVEVVAAVATGMAVLSFQRQQEMAATIATAREAFAGESQARPRYIRPHN